MAVISKNERMPVREISHSWKVDEERERERGR
jgi:hypothetical protein